MRISPNVELLKSKGTCREFNTVLCDDFDLVTYLHVHFAARSHPKSIYGLTIFCRSSSDPGWTAHVDISVLLLK